MPTYEYRCKLCKHHFEKLQPIASKPLRTCPSCGKKTLERVIGMGGGILVAGSGGTGSDRGRDEAQSASAGSSASGAGAKADATAAGNEVNVAPSMTRAFRGFFPWSRITSW